MLPECWNNATLARECADAVRAGARAQIYTGKNPYDVAYGTAPASDYRQATARETFEILYHDAREQRHECLVTPPGVECYY
jgi:hypothetical protein